MGGGITSGKLMTDDRGGNSSAAQSPRSAEQGSVDGRREGPGEGALSSPGAVSSLSGLGDLLASGGAGREPGGGTLLRAEAVLILREVGGKRSAVRAGDTGENQPTAADEPGGGPEDAGGLPSARAHVPQAWAVHVCARGRGHTSGAGWWLARF